MNEKAMELLEQLDELYAERDQLHHSLKRSLALQAIWPDAFAHGRCHTQVTGNPRRELTFTLKLANGERRDKPLEEVPVLLWPNSVIADIRQLGWQARKYHNILKGEDNAKKP